MVIQNHHCRDCGEPYENSFEEHYDLCRVCPLNDLKTYITNWTCDDEKVDNLIKQMQSRFNYSSTTIFEWIPYDQFIDVKEVGKGGFATVYLATWKEGPIDCDVDRRGKVIGSLYRIPNKKVALKVLHDSKNVSDEFLNEV